MEVDFWQSGRMAEMGFLRHGVTRRGGGVSEHAFASLNLGLTVGDAEEQVALNRQRVTEALGFCVDDLVCAAQVHGGRVQRVGWEDRGRGAREYSTAVAGTDALMTDVPGVLLMLMYADCIPVLLMDPVHQAVAVVHAGWRGMVAGAVENTVGAMREAYGTQARDLVAAIGPGIGQCCFEVGAEVAAQFPPTVWETRGDRIYVDLPAALRLRLAASGVAAKSVEACPACTFCEAADYFSHRRDAGRTGRMGALIGIPRSI